MKMKKIVFSWMLMGSLLLAQKVTQVKFEGLSHLSPNVAMEIADIHVGDEMNAMKINESIKNFFSQGYFKDVWVDQNGGVLTYHFQEKVAIANLEIKGYGSGDDADKLLKSIGLKKGDLYDAARVKKAKKEIISKLESEGYYDTVVEVTTAPVSQSSISVVLEVNKGEKIIIKKMNFMGASKLDQDDLELPLANKEEEFLGWMPWRNDGEAKVDQLEYDAYRVKDVYMKYGYLDAFVSKPLMRVDFGSYNAQVDYQVSEGEQYKVGTVAIAQDVEGLENKELMGDLTLKEGKVFNIDKMRKDIKYLEEQVGNLGYAYAKVSPQMHKNEEGRSIDIKYVIQPGTKVTINDVVISGNNETKDRVIRRYIYLAPGDQYNARDLKDSKNALGRTGFFESVDIENQRVSEDKINLLVKVKETATGSISAGGGYGSYEGLMFNASVADKNIFGSGIDASLGFDISKISTNYNVSFTNPKVWDSQYSLGVSFFKKKYEYYDFTQDQLGGTVMVGREFLRNFHASVGLGYVDNQSEFSDNNNSSYGHIDPLYKDLYNDKYKKGSVYFSLSYDNTDDFYLPREGMLASITTELANVSGDDVNLTTYPGGYGNFVKNSGKIGFYQGLEDWIDYDMILRLKGRFSTISGVADDEKLPTAEKLFLGGIGSVRGYDAYSISPLIDPSDPYSRRIGGKNSASTSVEASIPLSEAAKMRLAFFYDYGMIGQDSFNEIHRSSVGAQIEWQSMFGPINLVFAQPLDDKPGDQTAAFEFSMGSKF
ncbi:MAG: outer membrane protein assembly factor BamA [Campylobacterales bacterium]|nr:outer membrane protein assembly factor BamA [Campylobacterales bacterium]